MQVAKGTLKTPNGNVSGPDLVTLRDAIITITQVSTPATGSNGTQFTFRNSKAKPVSGVRVLEAYLSDANGVPVTAITSLAALTNGALDTKVTGKIVNVVTTSAGLAGITFTGSAATRYLSFVMPNRTIITSGAIVIN